MTQASQPSAAEIREAFERDGIVVLPNWIEGAIVDELDDYLQGLAHDPTKAFNTPPTFGETFESWVKVWPTGEVDLCNRLWADERVVEPTRAILGDEYDLDAQGAFCTPAGCGQGWHQDSFSDEPGQFVLNRIVFTRDYAPEQGELICVPGSAGGGDLPPGGNYEPLEGERRVTPTRGTLVLMHSRCFHQVRKNQTDEPRIQVNSRVRPRSASPELCRYAIFRTGRWDFNRAQLW